MFELLIICPFCLLHVTYGEANTAAVHRKSLSGGEKEKVVIGKKNTERRSTWMKKCKWNKVFRSSNRKLM